MITRLARCTQLAAFAFVVFAGCTDDSDVPGDHLAAKTTQLNNYGSCSDLESDLKDMLIRETWANIDRYNPHSGYGTEDTGVGDSSGGAADPGGGRTEGVDFSGTNNQETGVDEADLVKTDGYHIYAINGNRLHIFGTPNFGDLVPESVTQIEGHPREMLFDKDAGKAVIFSYIYVNALPKDHPLRALTGVGNNDKDWYWRTSLLTKITVLDITDRTHPHLVREVYYEGWYQTARKVDTSVRVSTYSQIDQPILWSWYSIMRSTNNNKLLAKREVAGVIHHLTLRDLIPQMFIRTPDGHFTTSGLDQASCQSFYRPTDSHARGIASIISFDLLGSEFHFDADHVVSNWATFYSSKDRIVLAEAAHDWWWYYWFQNDEDQLNVHVFDISQAGKSSYLGSGRISGQLSDQFAIDEDHGQIRLATTTNIWWRWWADRQDATPPPMENHVWVLQQAGNQFPVIGHVGGIGIGEQIQSVRFLGDKGYITSFKRVDPLFTIDLSDKTNPRVVGELKTPGYSTYIHPLGDSKLLTIGVGGDANGANWRTTIATFDVGTFAAPSQTASLPIEADLSWGWSEAMWEHKAFQYFAPKKMLAVPQSTWANNNGNYRYLSKLEVIDVDDVSGQLHLHGEIDHTPYYDSNHYWSYLQIRRSIFMGDFIYAISDRAITVHRLSDLGQVNLQLLPGYTDSDWYWWY